MKSKRTDVPLSKKMGDKLERAGDKISSSGAPKIGSFISRLGDKLEHAGEHKSDASTASSSARKPNK